MRVAQIVMLAVLVAHFSPAQVVTATVAVGSAPQAVAVNPVANKVYVANSNSNSVTVIDGVSNSTVTVSVGLFPVSLAVNQATNKIYVANRADSTVSVIDGATNHTASITVGSLPSSVAINQTTNKIYVANYGGNSVTVIDGATNSTTTIAVGTNPVAVAVNASTNKIYVANEGSANVTVIDGAANATAMVDVGNGSLSVALNTVTNKIYVANSLDATVTVIDGATNLTFTVNTGTSPRSVAVDPVANKAYVANSGSNNITVIDGATNRSSMVTVGASPIFVTVNQTTGSIYVANRNGADVTVIDGSTGRPATVPTGKSPVAVAVNLVTGEFYVANIDSSNVTVAGTAITPSAKISPAASVQSGFSLSAGSAAPNSVSPATYIAYGDSITYGTGASSTATQYTNLLASDIAAALTNRGVGGRQACDVAQIIMSYDNPPASLAPLMTLMVGTNDGYFSGVGPYEAVYKACHQASLAWLAIPSSQKTLAQTCVQSGSWQPDTTYLPGVALQSDSPGAALSCPVTSYGGPIYLWYRVTDPNSTPYFYPGSFSYSVDGGQMQSSNSFSNPPIATWKGGVSGVFLIRLTGVSAGLHTVQVTVNAASVSILAVGSLDPATQIGAPEVFAGGVIRFQYDDNASVSAAYNADAAADVALLSGDGLPVYFVPVRDFVNAYGDMADGFHPNDSGHMHLRDAFEFLSQFPLDSPASFSSTVTVTPANGFNSAVTLSASGWPTGITGAFGTNPVSKSSTVTISVAPTVAPGPYSLTVNGTGGGASASTTIPIMVAARPSFSLSATAAAATATSPGTSTLTVTPLNGFVPAVEFTPSGWPSGITATFAPGLSYATSTATISVTASVAPGLYNLTLKGFAGSFSATTTLALTVTAIPGIASSAGFIGIDTSTQGTWTGTYGADGYNIAAGATSLPNYAAVTFTRASTYTWLPVTTDVRALQTSPGSTDRLASSYVPTGSGNLAFSINLIDGAPHQVAIYFLDWDSTNRLQTVSISDALTGVVLDNRVISQLNGGEYGVWNIKGNVVVNVIANGPGAPIASAIFFGPPVAVPAVITPNSGATPQSATISTAFANALAVTVKDALGNPVPGVNVTFTAPTAGPSATLSAATATTNTSGVASVTAIANTIAGSYSVAVSAGSLITSFSLTNNAAAPATITANTGATLQSATVSTAFANALAVTVKDAFGNAVSGVSVTFTAPATGPSATLSGTSATTNASGIASVTASAGTLAGGYTVIATTGSLSTSFALTNNGAAPATITANTGATPQSATISMAFANALAVTVKDAFGNPISGVNVTFTAPATGPSATLSATSAATNASGIASVTASAGTLAGGYTVIATTGLLSTSFALTNNGAAPATITANTGATPQSATISMAFANALAVTVKDAFGNPVSGVNVTFTAPATGPSATLSATSATTNASGIASVTATANSPAGGPFNVIASVNSLSTSFALTNTYLGQTITFGSIPAQTVGTPLTLAATASSTLAVSYSSSTTTVCTVTGATATFLNAGQCSITAAQTGNATYSAAAPVTQQFTVNSAVSTISNLQAVSVGDNSEVITWNTVQPAASQVNYGVTSTYGSSTYDNTLVTSHAITLTNLSPNTTYNYDAVSASANGGTVASTNATFKTTPLVDYVAFWGVSNSGVTISWSTDLPANTFVAYGTTSALGQLSPVQTALTNSHGVTLSNLNPGTTYYFRAESTDTSGNTGASTLYSFTTTGAPALSAPVITSVNITNITTTGATITWTTDQAATSQVNYGTTSQYGASSPLNTSLVISHSVTLTALVPGTTYDFDVVSANATSNSGVSANFTFQTAADVIATPPLITNIQASVTSNTATITWTTDQNSNSAVNYGTSATVPDSNYVTSHSVTLAGLTPGTSYNFSVVSTDAAGLTTTSPFSSFTTPASNATPPYVGYVAFWSITNSGVTISWSTDVPATTQVAYGTTSSLGQLSPLQSTYATSHGVILTGLASGTTYYFVAQSTAANGATGKSTTYSFTTTGSPSAPAPDISNIQTTVTPNSATVTWTTDQAATSQVNYGVTTGYSASSTLNTSLTTEHSVTLTNLMPGTTYNFDVVSANINGLSATSANSTFQTGASGSGPVITGVTASSITSGTAVITWTTDQASSSVVNYGNSQTASGTGNVTGHSVTLTGLSPNTQYSFTVTSVNASNISATSTTYTFTTPGQSANSPVVGYVAFWSVTSSGVTISWSSSVPGTTAVSYGTTSSLGTTTQVQTAMTYSHGVALTGLQSGTTYYFQPETADANGNTGYSSTIYTFTTLNN